MIVSGFKRLLIGPDRGLRMLWRAVIFFALAYWVLPLALDPAFGFVADRLHLAAGLTASNVALNEFENFMVALICTALFARYERRRVDSYGLPVARAFGAHTGEGALACLGANLCVGVAEEFWFRSYFLQALWKSMGFWPASIVIALIFAADHYFFKTGENIWDVITLVSLSLMMCYSVLRTGTLWFAVGFHIAFDYMQLFVIGTPNGARLPQGRLLDASFDGPAWLTGGVLGTEASFLMYPMIALLWLYIWWRFRANPPASPADRP